MANFPILQLKSAYFLILFVEFPTYGHNRPIFLTNKTKKMNKIEKNTQIMSVGQAN